MRPIPTTAALLALAGTLGGCGLGCRDVDRIYVATAPGFGVTQVGAAGTTGAMLYGSLDYTLHGVPDFDEIFASLARNSGDGRRNLGITIHGYETPPGDRITLTLSIPTRAQQGERYRVTGAFAPPAWTDEWTLRRPVAAGEAEIGFMRSRPTIPNPPYHYGSVYTATRATGTLQVLRRERGHLDLQVDVTAADETGRAYRIAGTLGVSATTEGESCPTLS